MKKQISNIAAIINVNDDLRIIQDRAVVVSEHVAKMFNIEQVEADLANMADYSTESEKNSVKRILQLMTHYEEKCEDFMSKKFENANILFTVTVLDDLIEGIRNIIIDTKVFRKYADMHHHMSKESTRMCFENMMKNIDKVKIDLLSSST